MKLPSSLFFLLLGITICSGEINQVLFGDYVEGQRYIYFPDDDGQLIFVDLHLEEPEYRYEVESSVQFILHTRKGKEVIHYNDNETLEASNFDKQKPIKVVVHGWNNNGGSAVNRLIKNAFLENDDLNVIVVDWKKGATSSYTTSSRNAQKVGVFLGKFLNWLIEEGTSLKNFHLIGHSLGAHVVGIAGRSITEGAVPYITALDPANPLWRENVERLRPSDAGYVEVIHTDSGDLGLKEPVGHNDFYPNKGSRQPGCSILLICSHSRSYEYFADSIDHKGFMAIQCTDLQEMNSRHCANLTQLHMGGSSPKPAYGIFYLETNRRRHFYKGQP